MGQEEGWRCSAEKREDKDHARLKGLGHEIEFKYCDRNE
jgi:hypothetical protein